MDDIEVPQYFICPISLQIMKDPVTTITGITYDRESIEHWLFTTKNTCCPVTKQPLPVESDLTPNHTLRRLIQAWCTDNASFGIDRIPTPKPRPDKSFFMNLMKGLRNQESGLKTLKRLEVFAGENERNRKSMVEAGVSKALLVYIVNHCFKKCHSFGLQEALNVLRLVGVTPSESKQILDENRQVIKALTWVLRCNNMDNLVTLKSNSIWVLKDLVGEANSSVLETLNAEFFETIIGFLREKTTQQGTNSALQVLLDACPWGRNRVIMVESGAVFDLIELELGSPERRTTELIFGILLHLCSCADGRAQFLSHRGGMAVVARRILNVSPAADYRAVVILSMISKFSGTSMVLQEMLVVKAVSKLCMFLQSGHDAYLKDKVREILRSHYDVWKNSTCFDTSLFKASYLVNSS